MTKTLTAAMLALAIAAGCGGGGAAAPEPRTEAPDEPAVTTSPLTTTLDPVAEVIALCSAESAAAVAAAIGYLEGLDVRAAELLAVINDEMRPALEEARAVRKETADAHNAWINEHLDLTATARRADPEYERLRQALDEADDAVTNSVTAVNAARYARRLSISPFGPPDEWEQHALALRDSIWCWGMIAPTACGGAEVMRAQASAALRAAESSDRAGGRANALAVVDDYAAYADCYLAAPRPAFIGGGQ